MLPSKIYRDYIKATNKVFKNLGRNKKFKKRYGEILLWAFVGNAYILAYHHYPEQLALIGKSFSQGARKFKRRQKALKKKVGKR